MFIVELIYKAPLNEVDKYLKAHRQFLDDCYQQGILLASGPKTPRDGGILIAFGQDKNTLETTLKQDPFYMADIADYRFIEFTPIKYNQAIKQLMLETEGKLC